MANLVITIDGPAGSGKSTIARLLAQKIGAKFLDTGAMYRAVTLAAMQADIDMADQNQLAKVLDDNEFDFACQDDKMIVLINGLDTTEQIRSPLVTDNAHYVASSEKLREKLVAMQRQFAAKQEKVVTEGRDQGTVAFADADFKFFLTADVAERARRRAAELKTEAIVLDIEQIKEAIEKRDISDQSRSVGPLKPADDAIIVDTTELNIDQVLEKLLSYMEKDV